MIFPSFLRAGDAVGITAPSDGNSDELDFIRLDSAKQKLSERGYFPRETPNVRQSGNGRSGDAPARVREFTSLLEEDAVSWIVAAKGGDYLVELLSYLDFERMAAHPKWVQGFSDTTGLLFPITLRCDLATVYSGNFNDFGMTRWHPALERNLLLLEGRLTRQESFDFYEAEYHDRVTGLEGYAAGAPVEWRNLNGGNSLRLKGRLLGGCLDVLLSLIGTPYGDPARFLKKYAKDGILWYFETFALSGERVTTALWQLREAGWFTNASGVLFGRPAFYSGELSFEEAVCGGLAGLGLPVICGMDIGHRSPQMTMVNGALAQVESQNGGGFLQMRLKD